jgi:hypothetical protein
MSDSVHTTARELLLRRVQATQPEGLLVETLSHSSIERPKRPEHGDYATHVARDLAKAAGKLPHGLGEAIAKHLSGWTRYMEALERKDNAVWLRTTALWGDDKDRVVVRGQHPAATTAEGRNRRRGRRPARRTVGSP